MWPFSQDATKSPGLQYRIIKNGIGEYYYELSFNGEDWRMDDKRFDTLEAVKTHITTRQAEELEWRRQLALARQTEVVDGPHDY